MMHKEGLLDDWRSAVYWDVVEVIPEPDYCLFVRFKDGLKGRVRLLPEDLKGALGPLLDTEFFRRVYIDSGAVAWPGDIDLAPDAMYAQVAQEHSEREQAS
jgi:hypothetical protein